MKTPRRQLCHHFFKQSSPFYFNILKNQENASLHTLFSYFFTSQSTHVQYSQLSTLSPDPSSGPFPIEGSCAIETASSSLCKPITLLFINHSPVKNALWEARSSIFGRPASISAVVDPDSTASDLIGKTPSRSRISVLYKFSSDCALRERYRNPKNEIRIEKLLEDLDALAGTISYKHCSTNDGINKSLTLVTASVEKMILKKPICIDTDITIEGSVTWVGCSSLEIQLEVKQYIPEASNTSESLSLTANFTFVARDSKTGKSARINPILPETQKEKLLWQEAVERNKRRKKKKAQPKDIFDDKVKYMPPALEDKDNILISETCLQNSLVCQPEQRNIHGQIFGGFLLRKAFELAYATAYAFAGTTPCFVEVGHADFLRPVDVGDFLHLKSCVLYTELENPSRPLINVEVIAHAKQPEFLSNEISNKFYFTFTIRSDSLRNGLKIRNVVPGTKEEGHHVVELIDVLRYKRK